MGRRCTALCRCWTSAVVAVLKRSLPPLGQRKTSEAWCNPEPDGCCWNGLALIAAPFAVQFEENASSCTSRRAETRVKPG